MLIFSHRGYHAEVPQNTLASFGRAVAMGADGIETDVRLSADGIPILYHDRYAGAGMQVSQLTHAELEEIVGYSVPTLESALAELGSIVWDLEIKTASVVELTVDILRRYNSTRRVIVTSFLHPAVYEIARRADVEGGLIFAHLPQHSDIFGPPDRLHPRITTLVWDYEACNSKLITSCVEKGFKNFVYGPVTPSEHQEASSWLVHGIITDHPQLLK